MELLQFLLSFLTNDKNTNFLTPIIELLKNNFSGVFDALKGLDLSSIIPIISQVFSSLNNFSPTNNVGLNQGLTPIANIADKDIVYTLNKFLSESYCDSN